MWARRIGGKLDQWNPGMRNLISLNQNPFSTSEMELGSFERFALKIDETILLLPDSQDDTFLWWKTFYYFTNAFNIFNQSEFGLTCALIWNVFIIVLWLKKAGV
jgi:hypothetical protein